MFALRTRAAVRCHVAASSEPTRFAAYILTLRAPFASCLHRQAVCCLVTGPPASSQRSQHLSTACRTLTKKVEAVKDLPHWNYDGSSTGQAPGTDSEVYLIPRAMYKDPFRGGDNILVMCDTYEPPRVKDDNTVTDPVPLPTNTRHACAEVMEKTKDEVCARFALMLRIARSCGTCACSCSARCMLGLRCDFSILEVCGSGACACWGAMRNAWCLCVCMDLVKTVS